MRHFHGLVPTVLLLLCLPAPGQASAQTGSVTETSKTTSTELSLVGTVSFGAASYGFLSVGGQLSAYQGERGWALRGAYNEEFDFTALTSPAASLSPSEASDRAARSGYKQERPETLMRSGRSIN